VPASRLGSREGVKGAGARHGGVSRARVVEHLVVELPVDLVQLLGQEGDALEQDGVLAVASPPLLLHHAHAVCHCLLLPFLVPVEVSVRMSMLWLRVVGAKWDDSKTDRSIFSFSSSWSLITLACRSIVMKIQFNLEEAAELHDTRLEHHVEFVRVILLQSCGICAYTAIERWRFAVSLEIFNWTVVFSE
jgi:hypothetical protein